jgi:hypothetical protein
MNVTFEIICENFVFIHFSMEQKKFFGILNVVVNLLYVYMDKETWLSSLKTHVDAVLTYTYPNLYTRRV